MSIKENIIKERILALKAKDVNKKDTLSFALSTLKSYEIDTLDIKNKGIEINDEQAISLIKIIVNQKRETISYYEKLDKKDLIAKENISIDILNSFLPSHFSEEEINIIVRNVIKDLNATSQKDFGAVMKILKVSLLHKADMSVVSNKVKKILS